MTILSVKGVPIHKAQARAKMMMMHLWNTLHGITINMRVDAKKDDDDSIKDRACGCGGGCGCATAYLCGLCGEEFIYEHENDCLECSALYEIYLNESD